VQKTQLNHATHAAGVLPAREERKATRFSSDLTVCSMGADYPKNPRNNEKKDISITKTIGGCIGEI